MSCRAGEEEEDAIGEAKERRREAPGWGAAKAGMVEGTFRSTCQGLRVTWLAIAPASGPPRSSPADCVLSRSPKRKADVRRAGELPAVVGRKVRGLTA